MAMENKIDIPKGHVYRFTFTGIPSHIVCEKGQAAGLSGSVGIVWGFGAWGRETNVVLEIAEPHFDAVRKFVCDLLTSAKQSCAYVTVDGRYPFLLYADGGAKSLEA